MTLDEVRGIAEPIVHSVLGGANVQEIVVREEEDDWSGESALSVDVFVVPDRLPEEAEAYLDIRRGLSTALRAGGERRYAYLRLRDRKGEAEEGAPDLIPGA